jgi:hypothetical protein
MGVDDSHDVRPRHEDRRMNEALEIKAAPVVVHRLSVKVEFDDVFGAHQLRRKRAGDQEVVGIVRMSDAHMAVGVDDLLPGEDRLAITRSWIRASKFAHRVRPLLSFDGSRAVTLRRRV